MLLGYAVKSLDYNEGYSVDDISGGSKTLILVYKMPDKVILTKMGDNCTDLLEQIALKYAEQGKDLLVASDYLHMYNFKYIDAIEYMNWGIVCHSKSEIDEQIRHRWYEQEGVYEREKAWANEEPTDDEIRRMFGC